MTDPLSSQGERVFVHPILGVISGMCSDERPYPEIDSKVLDAKGRAHELEAERDRLMAENRRLRDLVDAAVYPITVALNCPAHHWHASDDARRWLMEAANA